MLKFFRHSYMAQLIVIVLLMVALWIPVFISHMSEVTVGSPTTPLYNLCAAIFGSSSLAMTVFAFVVFGTTVFFFNSMMTVNQMVTRNSSIAAFIYILCISCVPILDESYPFLLACPFIMIAVHTVYLIYQVEKPESYLMNMGFVIAVASMFYFPSIVLMVWVLLAMMIIGFRELRHYLIPLTGFMAPYLVLTAYTYFTRTLIDTYEAYAHAFSSFSLVGLDISTMEIIVLIVIIVFSLLSFVKITGNDADNSVGMRKKVGVTVVLYLFSILMLFTERQVTCNGLIYIVSAVSISMALCYVKKSRLVDIVIVILMLAVLANQYLPLFGIEI